jgi:hypothetical protein
MQPFWIALAAALSLAAGARDAFADPDPSAAPPDEASQSQELAKKLSNPVSDLISIPFQSNYDWGLNTDHSGWQYKLNIQPVVPFHLNSDWNLIARTIVPVISQDDVAIGSGPQTGLGDTTASFFFSPQKPIAGIIWGVGPDLLLPTATDRLLGTGKWGAGPTVVVLKQQSGWTIGMLANHIWSFAGQSDRREVSSTFLEPFLSYTTHQATTFTVDTESTYDWVTHGWTVPVNFEVAQLFGPKKTGLPVPIQVQLGYRYYFAKPPGGPSQGVRLNLVALLPE